MSTPQTSARSAWERVPTTCRFCKPKKRRLFFVTKFRPSAKFRFGAWRDLSSCSRRWVAAGFAGNVAGRRWRLLRRIILEALPFVILGSLASGIIEVFVSQGAVAPAAAAAQAAGHLAAASLGLIVPSAMRRHPLHPAAGPQGAFFFHRRSLSAGRPDRQRADRFIDVAGVPQSNGSGLRLARAGRGARDSRSSSLSSSR